MSPPPSPKPHVGGGWVSSTSRGGNMSLMTVQKRWVARPSSGLPPGNSSTQTSRPRLAQIRRRCCSRRPSRRLEGQSRNASLLTASSSSSRKAGSSSPASEVCQSRSRALAPARTQSLISQSSPPLPLRLLPRSRRPVIASSTAVSSTAGPSAATSCREQRVFP